MLNAAEILLFSLSMAMGLFFIWAAIVSKNENEPFAYKKFLNLGMLIVLISALLVFSHNLFIISVALVFELLAGVTGILLLLPFKGKANYPPARPTGGLDERLTMFSRRELKPDTKDYDEFYSAHPQLKSADDKFRKNPGLLSKGTTAYNPFHFASADASFQTVDLFYNHVSPPKAKEKVSTNPAEISDYIKNWAKKLGAHNCGICEIEDYHVYSKGGRKERRNEVYEKEHKYAIVFTVEMSKEMVAAAPKASIVMESGQQYLDSARISMQIASFLGNLGYDARAHIDANYKMVLPLLARDAGLGEIGRMGLLMTPDLGPRVRIGAVSTNLELITDKAGDDESVLDFCTICKKCADSCPSKAISFDDMQIIDGVKRWQINQEECFTLWTKVGTDCGRCMSVCPYSHENNTLHTIVRYGIKNNYYFRRLALKMDDVFYGRSPAVKSIPESLKI